MATLYPLHDFILTGSDKPRIGFRVVVSGGPAWLHNTLEPRNPQADATSRTLLHHLAWERRPSPFVSLWKSWSRAVKWAEDRAMRGASDIDIVAVWISDRVIYSAYEAATRLPLPQDKRPIYYKDEVIIIGLGGEDDLCILASFYWVTERLWETVTFALDREPSSTSLPVGLLSFETSSEMQEIQRREAKVWQTDAWAALRDEIYSRTGSYNDSKTNILALLLCETPRTLARVMIPRPTSRDIASDKLIAALASLSM